MKRLCLAIYLAVIAPPLAALELVMVEQDGCHYCEKWTAEIAPIYPKTSQGKRAPLVRVDLRALPTNIQFTSPPVFTPTFVLVKDGSEIARIEGYGGDEFFWFLLGQLFDQNLNAQNQSKETR